MTLFSNPACLFQSTRLLGTSEYCPPSRFSNLPPPSLALFNLFRHHKMMLTIALRQYSISIQENWTLLVYQTFTICSKYFWSRIYTLILHETFHNSFLMKLCGEPQIYNISEMTSFRKKNVKTRPYEWIFKYDMKNILTPIF